MDRRQFIGATAIVSLGFKAQRRTTIDTRYARVGTVGVTALGRGGADMVTHAMANGRMPWATAQVSLPNAETRLLLADPFEPGVAAAMADAVEVERRQFRRVLAVLRSPPVDARDDGQVVTEVHNLCSAVDVAVMVQCRHRDPGVEWEGLLSPFMSNARPCLDPTDLDNAARSGNATAVGCGSGAPLRHAMLAALEHPSLGRSRAAASSDLLVTISGDFGGVLLRDSVDAFRALRAAAPDARIVFAALRAPAESAQLWVHIVAFGFGPNR